LCFVLRLFGGLNLRTKPSPQSPLV
jgi:hypothetical protein